MSRLNWTISILVAGLLAALLIWLMGLGVDALLGADVEGTDTSWQTQLEDAGFGSGGVM